MVAELLDARLIAVFATLDRTGTIHAAPMWFTPDEQSMKLATGSRSRKVENLEVDSRSTLVIHDSRPGFEVRGASLMRQTEVVYGAEAGPLIGRIDALVPPVVRRRCLVPRLRSALPAADDWTRSLGEALEGSVDLRAAFWGAEVVRHLIEPGTVSGASWAPSETRAS